MCEAGLGASADLLVTSRSSTGLVWQPASELCMLISLIYHCEDEWPLSSAPLALSLSISSLCFYSPMYAFLFFLLSWK